MQSFHVAALQISVAMTTLLLSFSIHALNIGDRKPFKELERDLAADGQVEIARAKYVLSPEDPQKMKVLCVKFTINAKGAAYVLLSDDMDDDRAQTELVYIKLTRAKIFDPSVVGTVPAGVQKDSQLAQLLRQGFAVNDGVFLHGSMVKRNPEGKDVEVGLVTALANVDPKVERGHRYTVVMLITSTKGESKLDKVVGTNAYIHLPTQER